MCTMPPMGPRALRCRPLLALVALAWGPLPVGCSGDGGGAGSCPRGHVDVACASEGSVLFERVAVHVAGDDVYLVADLRWQPCTARHEGHKQRTFHIVATPEGPEVSLAVLPEEAEEVPAGPGPIEVMLESGAIVELQQQASDRVSVERLAVGALHPAGGATPVPIAIPVDCESL